MSTSSASAIPGAATSEEYSSIADQMVDRITALIPDHPEILSMESAWDLFDCGLKCDDLGPSLYQASWALARAKHLWNNSDS